MCSARAATWETAMLATATGAGIFRRCRYRTFSATPPTAAGVTSVTKELASWTRTVRKKPSRSATNPDTDSAAPA